MRKLLLSALCSLSLCSLSLGPAAQAADTMPAKAAVCTACHGATGNPVMAGVPALAGQTDRYMYLQLRDFQEGRRASDLMVPMVKDLSRDDMRAISVWFSAQKSQPQPFQPDAAKAKLGKAKSDETLCTMCHLGGFSGQNEVPRIAGQPFDYVVKQLRDFKARARTNDAGSMTSVSSTLSDADIDNLGHYLGGL